MNIGSIGSALGKFGELLGPSVQVAPSPFVERFVEDHHGSVEWVYAMLMTIPHMFTFHTKKKYDFIVDLYVLKRNC